MLLLLAAHAMLGLLYRVAAPLTWDYGPAQLAIYVDRLAGGAPLYRDFRIAPFMPLVYGPVVPSITAMLAPAFGAGPMAALEAGRLITIGSSLVVCTMIWFLARRIGASADAAAIATLAFMLSPIVLRWGFEYRVDMPALACELGGVFAFASGAPATAIALFVVSYFIKQGQAVGIATVVLYCWISSQRARALTLVSIWLAAVGAGTAILARLYPYYVLNSFGAVRTMHPDFAAPLLFSGIVIGGSLGLTIFAIVAFARRQMTDRLMICLLVVALIHDSASSLRWGSNAYYFLPTLAAITIMASPGIDLALRHMRPMRVVPQLAAGAALALLVALGLIFASRSVGVSPQWDPRALKALAVNRRRDPDGHGGVEACRSATESAMDRPDGADLDGAAWVVR